MDQLKNALQANYSFASPQYQNPALTINGVISQISLSFQQSQLLKSSLLIEHVPVTAKPELCSDISSQADRDILVKLLSGYSFQYPEVFEIHKFSVDAEYRLSRGNLLYFGDAAYLEVGKELQQIFKIVVSPCTHLKHNQQKKIWSCDPWSKYTYV